MPAAAADEMVAGVGTGGATGGGGGEACSMVPLGCRLREASPRCFADLPVTPVPVVNVVGGSEASAESEEVDMRFAD